MLCDGCVSHATLRLLPPAASLALFSLCAKLVARSLCRLIGWAILFSFLDGTATVLLLVPNVIGFVSTSNFVLTIIALSFVILSVHLHNTFLFIVLNEMLLVCWWLSHTHTHTNNHFFSFSFFVFFIRFAYSISFYVKHIQRVRYCCAVCAVCALNANGNTFSPFT